MYISKGQYVIRPRNYKNEGFIILLDISPKSKAKLDVVRFSGNFMKP